jgi:PPOX class probable F420-dependent enzyme
MKEQRRGRRIAMSPEEVDKFLAEERTCRVATVGADGRPHNTPLWFVWDGQSLWLNSIVKSQRWTDVTRRPQASVVVDAGDGYDELRGVEIIGQLELVGEAPRSSTPDAQLEEPERLFGAKYIGGTFQPDGRHAWMRLSPEKIVSWDFRKLMG